MDGHDPSESLDFCRVLYVPIFLPTYISNLNSHMYGDLWPLPVLDASTYASSVFWKDPETAPEPSTLEQ